MSEEKNYRHELKYAISHSDYLAMRTRLKAVMSSDPHVDSSGRYLIRSVYFDNSDDKALKEKLDGIGKLQRSGPVCGHLGYFMEIRSVQGIVAASGKTV